MSKNGSKITIGVGLAPLVVSVKEAKVNETILLKLITGLTPSGIIWRSDDGNEVRVNDDSTIVFTEAGFYIPVILGHPQHESYGITVSE